MSIPPDLLGPVILTMSFIYKQKGGRVGIACSGGVFIGRANVETPKEKRK